MCCSDCNPTISNDMRYWPGIDEPIKQCQHGFLHLSCIGCMVFLHFGIEGIFSFFFLIHKELCHEYK